MILAYGHAEKKTPPPDPAWWAMFSRLCVQESGNLVRVEEVLRELVAPPTEVSDGRDKDLLKGFQDQGLLKGVGEGLQITARGKLAMQVAILEQVFGKAEKNARDDRRSSRESGCAQEDLPWNRPWAIGDDPRSIDWGASLRNAARDGRGADELSERDLESRESEPVVREATVLLIDVSRSMVIYGEDRLTPAKMVAIALSESVLRTPGDSLDVLAFGNRARRIPSDAIMTLSAEPSQTDTADGLRLAREILRTRKASRRKILLVTDGKPTCVLERGRQVCDPDGRDPRIIDRTIEEGVRCAKDGCRITTFMLARDPQLVAFVDRFTRAVRGQAFHTGLDQLGEFVLKSW